VSAEKRNRMIARVRSLLGKGESREALGILKPYLARHYNDIDANALAGEAHGQLGELPLAEVHFKRSLAAHSDQFEVGKMLLQVLVDLNKWEEALELADRLRREDPNDRRVQILRESCLEHVERPEVGWERESQDYSVRVEFAGDE
jgi:tetratricopeptide (TPR) repeat protein